MKNLFLLIMFFITLYGCSNDQEDAVEAEISVVMNPIVEQIKVGGERQLTLTCSPEDLDTSGVVWKSSNVDVATVSSSGLVKALKKGHTELYITGSINGKLLNSVKHTLTVSNIEALGISLNSPEITLRVGQSFTIEYSVYPFNTTCCDVELTIEDEKIATLKGMDVVAVSSGITFINAEVVGTDVSIKSKIEVKPAIVY